MGKWLSKSCLVIVAIILSLTVVIAPKQAQAVPYDCEYCMFDFDLKNVVWYYETYYNGRIPLDIEWDVSHPMSDNNQAAWENAVLTPNAGGMSMLPIWDFASNASINDQGRQESAKLRMELTYPENEVVLEDVVETVDIHTGNISTMSGTMGTLSSAVSAMGDAVEAMETAVSAMPDDLGDLAEGSDSKHFTASLKTKITDLPTASTLTANLAAKVESSALGTAAYLAVPSSGDATGSQVVKGNDSRLTDSRSPTSHNHAASEITSGTLDTARIPSLAISKTTDLQTALDEKSLKSSFTALSTLSAHGVSNGDTDGATDALTDAPTNAPTNYGVLAAILGADANATNAKQNATAANVNALAAKYNALATKYNDLSTKFNTILTYLGTSRTAINNLKTAGAN